MTLISRWPARTARRGAAAAAALVASTACADRATGPTSDPGAAAIAPTFAVASAKSYPTGVVRWNAVARQLVAAHQVSPPRASRIYAYLSVAQDRAIGAARGDDDGDAAADGSQRGAVLGASSRTLAYFFVTELGFAGDAATIAAEAAAQRSALPPGGEAAGESLGQSVAESLIGQAGTDGADAPWLGTVPVGPGYWIGTNPQLPMWGQVRTWFLTTPDQLRAPLPPAVESARYLTDLAEVRQISDTRTAEQLAIAQRWADGAGTATPPGHWNQIAADLIVAHHLNERKAAHAMAFVNMAMMDAVIACWDSKFAYWMVRPYQVDPLITTPIGRPPHPSYPSGHSCSSHAAAGVLGELFPKDRAQVEAMAVESGMSRVYAGIHYRFDIEAGTVIGRSVAALALASEPHGPSLMATAGSPSSAGGSKGR